jgi:hypothetical protein
VNTTVKVTREHRVAVLLAWHGDAQILAEEYAWAEYGRDAAYPRFDRMAQALAGAEARGRAAERADVVAWLRTTTDGTRACRDLVALDIERGEHSEESDNG